MKLQQATVETLCQTRRGVCTTRMSEPRKVAPAEADQFRRSRLQSTVVE